MSVPGSFAPLVAARPLRVAVVGAGPAGIYAAEALSHQDSVPVSVDLLDVIYTCQVRQEWYRDHQLFNAEAPLDFVGSARVSDPVEATPERMGALLDWKDGSRAR